MTEVLDSIISGSPFEVLLPVALILVLAKVLGLLFEKIKVPAEMAIMGFDGCEEARRRGISTITIPAGDIGSWGVYFLNGLRTADCS